MNRAELRAALDAAEVQPRAYSLDGGLPDERLCLEERADGWAVYYSERGLRTTETLYPTESEACDAFYAKLLRDPMVHPGVPPGPEWDWMRAARERGSGGESEQPG